MIETQQYLFDLNGYLVVEDVLSPALLKTLNERIDAQNLADKDQIQRIGSAAGGAPQCPGFLQWGQEFCDLLDHEAILPILRFRLGTAFVSIVSTAFACAPARRAEAYMPTTVFQRSVRLLLREKGVTLPSIFCTPDSSLWPGI